MRDEGKPELLVAGKVGRFVKCDATKHVGQSISLRLQIRMRI